MYVCVYLYRIQLQDTDTVCKNCKKSLIQTLSHRVGEVYFGGLIAWKHRGQKMWRNVYVLAEPSELRRLGFHNIKTVVSSYHFCFDSNELRGFSRLQKVTHVTRCDAEHQLNTAWLTVHPPPPVLHVSAGLCLCCDFLCVHFCDCASVRAAPQAAEGRAIK